MNDIFNDKTWENNLDNHISEHKNVTAYGLDRHELIYADTLYVGQHKINECISLSR